MGLGLGQLPASHGDPGQCYESHEDEYGDGGSELPLLQRQGSRLLLMCLLGQARQHHGEVAPGEGQ
jgi:hypothetical protein